MSSSNYSRIKNTQLEGADWVEPITAVLLSGKDSPLRYIDTTTSPVNLVLSSAQWKQACISLLIVENTAGDKDINLVPMLDDESTLLASALQSALELNQDGATITMQLVRSGEGTAQIKINGTLVMPSTANYALILVQAIRTRGLYIENKIQPVLTSP